MKAYAGWDEGDVVYIDLTGTYDIVNHQGPLPEGVIYFNREEAKAIMYALADLFVMEIRERLLNEDI